MTKFSKYSSNGNDFILIDNRDGKQEVSNTEKWQQLCQRCFGIGADGVVFLESSDKYDFHMRYLNADGNEESMCGNATRAITDFYRRTTGTKNTDFKFTTGSGLYSSGIEGDVIWVHMTVIKDADLYDLTNKYEDAQDSYYINTGVEHSVFMVYDAQEVDVDTVGRRVRFDEDFPRGSNANFINQIDEGEWRIRTYERGVEAETFACGTGNVAAACMLWDKEYEHRDEIEFLTNGGILFVKRVDGFIYLGGQTKLVYTGEFND
ncbi:diaminopimelate epimerase [Halobacteriovorax sp. ZH4_bin.1]|uniref:diaminopimelate epimerase n=1 Tax=unclassified Halobacteriovorax TaxID=2639665 RepID=UPI003722BE11